MNRIAKSAPERNSLRLFLIRDYRLLFSAQIIASPTRIPRTTPANAICTPTKTSPTPRLR